MLVLALNQKGERYLGVTKAEELSLALQRLERKRAAGVCKELFDGGSVFSGRVEPLGPAEVPYRHLFDLRDYRPKNIQVWRM